MPSTKKFRFTDKNGNTIEVDIGAEGENVTIDGQKLTDLLNGKADKQNSEGGFAAGYQASSGDGGAVGYQAKVNYGGGAVGYNTETDYGGAMGNDSKSEAGCAIGNAAITSDGVAVGKNAKTIDSSGNGIDAIQLGTGTNSTEKTIQVYNYQLMSANGKIPADRLSSHASASNTYGAGTSSNYGHVKLSDSTSSTSGTSGGTAATPAAVKAAYDKANIKKNSDSDTGDIISTHLTVGTRGSGGSIGNRSFTSGLSNTASGNSSISVGYHSTASGDHSIAMGYLSEATGDNSVSLGRSNTASGSYSLATGFGNKATGDYSVAMNYWNTALDAQTVTGHYNKEGIAGSWTGTIGDAFIIGNGSSRTHSNAFRVAYNGSVYALSAFNSTGADYAELLEWEDGNSDNADRRGLFVTWGTDDKIKIASPGDEIVGIISATSSVIGNAYEDSWQGMYLTDAFGQPVTQTVHHDAEYVDVYVPDIGNDGGALDTNHVERQLLHEAYDAEEYVINPDYDPTQEYIPRSQRKEWATVGMLGQLIVIDDGSCTVGGHCAVGDNGKATAFESGYKVLKRIDDTHIKVFFK